MAGAHLYRRSETQAWWCSFTVAGRRYRRSTNRRDRGEAFAAAARLYYEEHQRARVALPEGAPAAPTATACALYLVDLRHRLDRGELARGPKFYGDQEGALARVAQRWKDLPLSEIAPDWSRALADWHAGEDALSWRSLQVVTVAVRHLLRWASKAGHLDGAVPEIEAPTGEQVGVEAQERRPFTAQERDAFLRALRKLNPRAHRIYTVLFYTAARQSDLERLTLRQVDWRTRFVALPPRQTKSRKREQVLYLQDKALAALRAEVRARGIAHPDALIFGKFDLRAPFRAALDAAGIKDRDGLVAHHSTRHTAATLAADAGASLAELMAFGRWATPQMVARYMKVRAAQAKKAARRL